MLMRVCRFLLCAGPALLGAAPVASAAESLAGSSPFLPPSSAPQAAAPGDTSLELRGIMASGDAYMFSIYDAARRSSVWKHLDEPGHEFVVRSYDAARDAVTVEYQGRTLTLALKTAKVASAPVPPPAPPGAVQPAGAQPIGGPVVLNPTPADEQRRLEAIAAEVNRRRMIRQQALQASRAAAGQQPRPPPAPQQAR